jgi:hypothetical protein
MLPLPVFDFTSYASIGTLQQTMVIGQGGQMTIGGAVDRGAGAEDDDAPPHDRSRPDSFVPPDHRRRRRGEPDDWRSLLAAAGLDVDGEP